MNVEDDKTHEQLLATRLIEQTFTNWVNPELEKRKNEGKLSKDFRLTAAQVIFSVGDAPKVRINLEVKGIFKAKVKKPFKKGETVLEKDVESIESFSLLDEDKDFGHITIVNLSQGWFTSFSFIYDVSKSRELLNIALEFMEAARLDLRSKRNRAFVENAFIAFENLAKARLYLLPDQEIRKAKTHGLIQQKVNMYSQTDSIIKTTQKDAFNKLVSLRDRARYEPKFTFSPTQGKKILQAIQELSSEVQSYLIRF